MKSTYKIILLLSVILVSGLIILAQTTSPKPVGNSTVQKYEYCRFVFKTRWNSFTGSNTTKTMVVQFNSSGESSIYQSDAAAVSKLTTLVDGLNFLGSKGWELVATYVDEGEGWSDDIHLLKRKL